VQTLTRRAKPLNTPDQALKLMRIIDAAYASARTGRPMKC
jgi:predicted dehydrogenase